MAVFLTIGFFTCDFHSSTQKKLGDRKLQFLRERKKERTVIEIESLINSLLNYNTNVHQSLHELVTHGKDLQTLVTVCWVTGDFLQAIQYNYVYV